jgi:iron complex outermembrane receptor protein
LRYVPRHQLKGSAGAQILVSSVTIFGDVFAGYSSRRYITTDATQWLESYLTFDAHLRCRWRLPAATIVFGFLLENSTNHSYEIIKGYPMPPRRLRFQLSLELPGALQNASSSGPKK